MRSSPENGLELTVNFCKVGPGSWTGLLLCTADNTLKRTGRESS